MFTGIIEEVGKIQRIENISGKKYLAIRCSKVTQGLKIGDSVCCNGICLSIVNFTKDSIKAEAMPETLSVTTSRFWKVNDSINLERAMSANSRFDGHIVQGHIDTISKRLSKSENRNSLYLEYELLYKFAELIVNKGSVAINGVSLTVAEVGTNSFKVAVIGLTKEHTNLISSKYVNLEFDILGKYVQRMLNAESKKKMNPEILAKKGF
jgi:riboflavin synthase